jgi:hypothetical protein
VSNPSSIQRITMAARGALDAFLTEWAAGGEPMDDALVEYICSVLEDDEDDGEALLEQLQDLLGEVAPRLRAAPRAAQTAAIVALVETARAGGSDGGSGDGGGAAAGPSGAPAATAEDLVASLRQLSVAARAADEACAAAGGGASGSGRAARTSSCGSGSGGGGGPSGGGGAAAGDDSDLENADPQALAALGDMCCGIASERFLAHVLVRACSGDVEVRAAGRAAGRARGVRAARMPVPLPARRRVARAPWRRP